VLDRLLVGCVMTNGDLIWILPGVVILATIGALAWELYDARQECNALRVEANNATVAHAEAVGKCDAIEAELSDARAQLVELHRNLDQAAEDLRLARWQHDHRDAGRRSVEREQEQVAELAHRDAPADRVGPYVPTEAEAASWASIVAHTRWGV
jgi:hypothetical protein